METLELYKNKIYDSKNNSFFHRFYDEILGKRILDVGCGSGGLGLFLKNHNNIVYGVTVSEEEAVLAREKLDGVIVMNAENISELSFPHKYFDVIIFSDSLEHLRNPSDVLRKVKPFLCEGGLLIASIPNIANFKIRLGLLCGNFKYTEGGILDNTHLRFFTLQTAKELILNAGYNINQIKYTNWSLEFSSYFGKIIPFKWKLRDALTNLWPRLFATQFVIYGRN